MTVKELVDKVLGRKKPEVLEAVGMKAPKKANAPATGISDILQNSGESSDARQKVFSEIVQKLFDPESLLMISRVSQELAYYIVKHLIVEGIYYQYWLRIKIIRKAVPCDVYPFYRMETVTLNPGLDHFKMAAYKKLIDQILMITISYDGKGREEALSVIKSAEAKLMEQELMDKQGMLGKFLQ
jgi:hypothetical protein